MPGKRTLSLRRETLIELASTDLAVVAGAADSGPTCPTVCPTGCASVCDTRCVYEAISGSTCPDLHTLVPPCR
jgi:hypothetical protein